MLVSAMAYSTENLGFAFTSSVFQAHPFTFARQMSTLDHLTKGRVISMGDDGSMDIAYSSYPEIAEELKSLLDADDLHEGGS